LAVNQGSRKQDARYVLSPGAYRMCAAAVIYALGLPVYAANTVTPFRLTGIEGHVELRYREDEQVNGVGGVTSRENRRSNEQEIFLLTHSYVYHPNFLKMDLGIGPVFSQYNLDTSLGSVSDETTEYNLLARLHFLDEKPYPLLLYYERDNPTVALTVTDRFQQKSERYGFDFKLREPVLPFTLSLGASRHSTDGQGFDLRIKDEIDQATIRAQMSFDRDGYGQFVYNTTDARSETGFLTSPVVTTNTRTDNYTFDSRLYYGDHNQIQLSNYLTYTEQSGVRPLKQWRYTPELRWSHSNDLESFYRLNYSSSDQVTVSSRDIGASGGFRYKKSDNTNITGEVHTNETNGTGLDLTNYGASGSVAYKKEYSFGVLNLSAGLTADYYDRNATTMVPVVDLLLDLIGTAPQFLPHNNIDRATIRVFRVFSGGSQTELTVGVDTVCDGTIDILVTSIDARTTIENCNGAIDGNIQVSVSYNYDPGGTVTFTNFAQAYQANLQIYQNYNLYMRYHDNNPNVIAGTPSQQLSESRNTQVGARVDYPLYKSLRVGGEVKYEKEDGNIYSFTEDSAELHAQFGVFNGLVYASTRRVNTDYAGAIDDIEFTRNSLQFRARPWNRVGINANISDEEELRGTTLRKTRMELLSIEWRLRRLIMQAEARHVRNTFGTSERERSLIKLTIRRDF
jgi:hypothetical protein